MSETTERDPVSDLTEKFRESLVERGKERVDRDSVRELGVGQWEVNGLEKMNDSYGKYSVTYHPQDNKYTCSCYDHQYGGSRERSICSHVMAVIIHRKMGMVDGKGNGTNQPEHPESHLNDLIDSVWPHEEYRNGQREVIADALRVLFNEGKDYYVVSAPTGFGKSPVCVTLSSLIGMINERKKEGESVQQVAKRINKRGKSPKSGKHGYYVTPQNILLDQLEEDYGDLDLFNMLKGRSNYECSNSDCGETCSDGPCRYSDDLECDQYGWKKGQTFESEVANTNFSLFMVHPQVESRPGLVIDEAHMMPSYVLDKVSVELREDRLTEWNWDIPHFSNFEDYVEWMIPKTVELEGWVEDKSQKLRQASNSGNWNEMQKKMASKVDRTQRLQRKMQNLVGDWGQYEEPWVVEHDDFYDKRRGEEVEKVSFRPITPYRFVDDLVFKKAEKTVISSATPPDNEFLGLSDDEVHLNEIPSDFPVENRKVFYDPIGKMSSSNREANAQKAALKIQSVAVGNTLVHSHTYDLAEKLAETLIAVGEDPQNIVIQKRGEGKQREEYLNEWANSDAQYFFSVNYYDGLDLPDDLCRTNIICVCPFSYLGDPQVQKRKEQEGDDFIHWDAAMRIQQAAGRSTRSKEDWSSTWILDENWGWHYHQNKRDFYFEWFREAVEWKPSEGKDQKELGNYG